MLTEPQFCTLCNHRIQWFLYLISCQWSTMNFIMAWHFLGMTWSYFNWRINTLGKYSSTGNPVWHVISFTHYRRVRAWCILSIGSITTPVYYTNTMNTDTYGRYCKWLYSTTIMLLQAQYCHNEQSGKNSNDCTWQTAMPWHSKQSMSLFIFPFVSLIYSDKKYLT